MEAWLDSLRRQIPIVESKVYLDNAGAGPLTTPVMMRIVAFLGLWQEEGEPWDEALEDIVEARRLFARLIGASLEEVAAVPGVSYGFNALVSSLRLDGRGNVVAGPVNFPTTYYTLHALKRRGLVREVRIVGGEPGPSLEEWEKAIDDETRLVVADHVSWITGYMEDLKSLSEIAHGHGAILVTDAFHSVGVVPVDVKRLGVDALVTGSYKWLMAPHGAGMVYVSRGLQEELDPMLSGWMAVDDGVIDRMQRGERLFERPFNTKTLNPAKDARILEWGTWPAISFIGLLASLEEVILKYDAPGRYENHTRTLVERLIDGLEEAGHEVITPRDRKAAIVTFRHPEPYKLAEKLKTSGVIVSPRPGRIRVSPHFYNTKEEIDKLLETVGIA